MEKIISEETYLLAKEVGFNYRSPLSVLMKWIRDTKYIYIEINIIPNNRKYFVTIYPLNSNGITITKTIKLNKKDCILPQEYENYEMAVEEGLKFAIKYITISLTS